MNLSVNGQSQVPPGFRFHPTEEELLHYYLRKKIANDKIDLDVIREVDLNKLEPWDIQEKCKIGSTPQNDWYLFSHKDKKYPTGTRTNRATAAGFWKATGRDKVIYGNRKRIGMRKTLVFYKGRAPHGLKLDWIMHEYRLDDNSTPQDQAPVNFCASESGVQEEGWVVCRVFKKKSGLEIPQSSSAAVSRSTLVDHQNPNTDGVVDQILMYMERSSKQQNEQTKHSINNSGLCHVNNNANTQFDTISSNGSTTGTSLLHVHAAEDSTFLHLPELIHQDCSFMLKGIDDNSVPVDDWVALDRLVASQLNGQLETSSDHDVEFWTYAQS